jgi:gluconate kinase
MILLLTGACAAGKSTIAQILAEQHNFVMIDGDAMIKELGLKSKDWNQVHNDLIKRAEIASKEKGVVISHVVFPDKFHLYQKHFQNKNIPFKTVVLHTQKEILYKRNLIRTCHPKPTPENIIDYFHKELGTAKEAGNIMIIDSTQQTPLQTVTVLLERLFP